MMTNSKSLAENNSRIKDFFRYIGGIVFIPFLKGICIFLLV